MRGLVLLGKILFRIVLVVCGKLNALFILWLFISKTPAWFLTRVTQIVTYAYFLQLIPTDVVFIAVAVNLF